MTGDSFLLFTRSRNSPGNVERLGDDPPLPVSRSIASFFREIFFSPSRELRFLQLGDA
jgi:hypothetical protein